MPEPDSVTATPSFTVRAEPASAVGGSFTPVTVTVTVSGALSEFPSLTFSEKTRSSFAVSPPGAVKVGAAALLLPSDTVVPEVWVQA